MNTEFSSPKNILVPVDFTPESLHALRYARMLATSLKFGITLAHVHQPIFDPVTGSALDVEMMKEHQEYLEKMKSDFLKELRPSEKYVEVDTLFDVGDISSQLCHLADDDKYVMIVMSTRSENTYLKRLLGSVSTLVGRRSSKPVIIVPAGSALRFPDHMVVGVSEELFKDNAIEYILDFALESKTILDFVHISRNQEDFNKVQHELSDILNRYSTDQIHFSISMVAPTGDHIEQTLIDVANQKRADMLVLATHYRPLIEALGHRSTSKKLLFDPPMPVMVIHGHRERRSGSKQAVHDLAKES